VEGQGVSYKIKEPPAYPTRPLGLHFVHFFLAAPFLGFLVPIGLLVVYIQFDPRLRFVERLQFALPDGVQVLGVIPHVITPMERRVRRTEWVYIGIFVLVVMLFYAAVAVVRLLGVA
jgi:hypothetical protein